MSTQNALAEATLWSAATSRSTPKVAPLATAKCVLALKVSVGAASALPPDVRRWLCPAVGAFCIFGLCPWCGLWPNKSEGLSPDQGHSPETDPVAVGGA
jgi:hypothetical protein